MAPVVSSFAGAWAVWADVYFLTPTPGPGRPGGTLGQSATCSGSGKGGLAVV
jgi:hypothetical protein